MDPSRSQTSSTTTRQEQIDCSKIGRNGCPHSTCRQACFILQVSSCNSSVKSSEGVALARLDKVRVYHGHQVHPVTLVDVVLESSRSYHLEMSWCSPASDELVYGRKLVLCALSSGQSLYSSRKIDCCSPGQTRACKASSVSRVMVLHSYLPQPSRSKANRSL